MTETLKSTSQITRTEKPNQNEKEKAQKSSPERSEEEEEDGEAVDLTLLENQIPLFVITTLARILFPSLFTRDDDHLVSDLAFSLFGYTLIRCSSVANFLHLLHLSSVIDEGQKLLRFDVGIRFSKGVLEIPPLDIVNTTEIDLRNFIAWEHSRIGINSQSISFERKNS
ncbi:hypothetical protein K1719_034284 [Acacia pycnantha]|nr:hypothetical protein K1719_034284 [Acacia pycnantha]